jgi:hypothetical protein
VYFTNINLIFFILPFFFYKNHNNSTDIADRFRLPLNPLQVSLQYLLLQYEAYKSLYRSPGPYFLDCAIDPYVILCSPLAVILDRIIYCGNKIIYWGNKIMCCGNKIIYWGNKIICCWNKISFLWEQNNKPP